jgi:tRNA modification GTPase
MTTESGTRCGFVAIVGAPNAGKSTLLNRIARREAAIVSPVPGTTRDVIEVHLDLDGYPVTLLDTAGIRDSDDPVEQEGVRRARQRASEADLVLWVQDARDGDAADRAIAVSGLAETWVVRNKIDLVPKRSKNESRNEDIIKESIILFDLSATIGLGVAELLTRLGDFARDYLGAEPALLTRERHKNALTSALISIFRALQSGASQREEILAEELRSAARSLGRLTGRVDVEDILDVIFQEFCIGK